VILFCLAFLFLINITSAQTIEIDSCQALNESGATYVLISNISEENITPNCINIINDTLTESLTEPKANEEVVLDKIMGVIDTHVSNYNQITLEREIEKVLTTQRVTDEEITKASKELCLDSLKQSMFRKGAKWLRDKK